MVNKLFWKNKRVLITGHTGFKGSWLCVWLISMGAEVLGYSLAPKNPEDNFVLTGLADKMTDIRGDIRDKKMLSDVFLKYQPEIVFHLAAQPLVIDSYQKPYETYDVNVMGTLNVLECIRKSPTVRTGVFITTDKCYENKNTLRGYVETDAFGGHDPYSSSKACDEILIASYRKSFFCQKGNGQDKGIATVRAGNVIGGGDWSDNRIIPDCIRAIEKNEAIQIRNKNSVRPWQHVLEPLAGYMMVAEKLWENPKEYAEGWNFGPEEQSVWTVWDVAGEVIRAYGKGERQDSCSEEIFYEEKKLILNIDKAKTKLGWAPMLDVKQAIKMTVAWYQNRKNEDAYEICLKQIQEYENCANIHETERMLK